MLRHGADLHYGLISLALCHAIRVPEWFCFNDFTASGVLKAHKKIPPQGQDSKKNALQKEGVNCARKFRSVECEDGSGEAVLRLHEEYGP